MKNTLWMLLVITLVLTNGFFYMQNVQLRVELDEILGQSRDTLNSEVSLASPGMTSEREMPLVAVSNNGEGVLGKVNLKLMPGEDNILVDTQPFLEADLQYSANKAVSVAKETTKTGSNSDYILDFEAQESDLLGGESAGAAMTILTIAALENKTMSNETMITGTINEDGTIGPVGGVYAKAKAVSEAGYKTFLVPEGQSVETRYERTVTRGGYGFRRVKVTPVEINIKEAAEEWGLEIVEVSNVDEALPYFFA